MKKCFKWCAVALLVAVAALAVVYRAVNRVPSETLAPNERVYEILVEGGCLSCHSADPEVPFYAKLPVAGKVIMKDIDSGYRAYDIEKFMADVKDGAEPSEVTSTPIEEEVEEEPEVEVELVFDEEIEDESEERGDRREKIEDESEEIEEPAAEPAAELPITPIAPSTPTPKRSALLSLYEDEPKPVLGEQFHEAPSVADTIACPKGIAESAPVASLRDGIGVADKFMLVRELFVGDADAYEQAISALDAQPSFDDCVIYIAENYTWSPNAQATKFVMELLNRKYN